MEIINNYKLRPLDAFLVEIAETRHRKYNV
jgi:hypothetical protein